MCEERIKKIISELFFIEIDDINNDTGPRNVPEWKGAKHREFIELLENEFSIEFESDERDTLINFKIIKATVSAYLDD